MREETRCRHMGYSFRITARVLLYAPSHRQDSTYHGLCYTSRGELAGTSIATKLSSVSITTNSYSNAFTSLHASEWINTPKLNSELNSVFNAHIQAIIAHACRGHSLQLSTGLSVRDRMLVVSTNPVRG